MEVPVHGDHAAHVPTDDASLGEGQFFPKANDSSGQPFRRRVKTTPASWFLAKGGDKERLLSAQPVGSGVQAAKQAPNASPRRTTGHTKAVTGYSRWRYLVPEEQELPSDAAANAAWDEQPGSDEELEAGRKMAARRTEAFYLKKVPLWKAATLVLICLVICICIVAAALGSIYGQKPAPCPEDGWIWSKEKCYYFSKNTNDWKSSQKFCSSKGSSLAILKDPVVLKTIFRFKDSSQDYWIGLQNIRVPGHQEWQYVDGSPFENEVELHQSEGPDLDCICLNSKKAWALHCASSRPWICVKDSM